MAAVDDDMETDVEALRLPYSRRPEWADVSAIHVDDGNCVVAVQYTDEHRDALAYFRAVIDSGEKSDRVLQLTGDMIGFNQADYTAWQYRWLCVDALNSDLEAENQLTENIMRDNAKNYQLWNHRRKCALKAGPSVAQQELRFAMRALEIDEKNYHAWAHRMAVVEAFNLWQDEIPFVEEMITKDVRNNSAWNHRAYAIKRMLESRSTPHTPVPASDQMCVEAADAASAPADTGMSDAAAGSREELRQVLEREVAYVATQVRRAARNESAWNYLLGLFTLPGCRKHEMASWPQVYDICLDALAEAPSCPPALAALAEYYFVLADTAMQHVAAIKAGTMPHAASPAAQGEPLQSGLTALHAAVGNAASLLDGLTMADPIRSMYWVHRHQVLQQLLLKVAPEGSTATAMQA